MHKMIRCDIRKINRHYDRLILGANIPSITAAVALVIIYELIIKGMNAPQDFYRMFFFGVFLTSAYSFGVTLPLAVRANIQIKGHRKYTYIEMLREQIVVSRYVQSSFGEGGLRHYRRLWLINLADVDEVTCTRTKVIIKGKTRYFETQAKWLDYEESDLGKADFDYWWYSEFGGEELPSAAFPDCYFYAERVAQRIIFCSEKQKAREIRREEFRRRMLEIAQQKRKHKKPKERVFRGGEIDRRFL